MSQQQQQQQQTADNKDVDTLLSTESYKGMFTSRLTDLWTKIKRFQYAIDQYDLIEMHLCQLFGELQAVIEALTLDVRSQLANSKTATKNAIVSMLKETRDINTMILTMDSHTAGGGSNNNGSSGSGSAGGSDDPTLKRKFGELDQSDELENDAGDFEINIDRMLESIRRSDSMFEFMGENNEVLITNAKKDKHKSLKMIQDLHKNMSITDSNNGPPSYTIGTDIQKLVYLKTLLGTIQPLCLVEHNDNANINANPIVASNSSTNGNLNGSDGAGGNGSGNGNSGNSIEVFEPIVASDKHSTVSSEPSSSTIERTLQMHSSMNSDEGLFTLSPPLSSSELELKSPSQSDNVITSSNSINNNNTDTLMLDDINRDNTTNNNNDDKNNNNKNGDNGTNGNNINLRLSGSSTTNGGTSTSSTSSTNSTNNTSSTSSTNNTSSSSRPAGFSSDEKYSTNSDRESPSKKLKTIDLKSSGSSRNTPEMKSSGSTGDLRKSSSTSQSSSSTELRGTGSGATDPRLMKELSLSTSSVSSSSYTYEKVFTVGKEGGYLFNFKTLRWSQIGVKDNISLRKYSIHSVISTHNYLYVFGGSTSSDTYSRYYKGKRIELDCTGKIYGGKGGEAIAACYDNRKTIYLVGGQYDGFTLLRVVSMNTETKEFKWVCEFEYSRSGQYAFFHNGLIYVVGANAESSKTSDELAIWAVTPDSGKLTLVMNDCRINTKTTKQLVACCFDGKDLIYILDAENYFYTISITTLHKSLHKSPTYRFITGDQYTMILFNNKTTLMFIGGRAHGNQVYSIKDNFWTVIKDNDRVDRCSNGAVLFEGY
ncbi:hypothetical protein SAMD00019534_043490 [Acytostelium subglobosum LB1]|uniref:hypothetical protein n=1 Tax=Acytostelium subglobosum LB1 TaxID=1410327 RepID=UPI000644E394|nr:hypothetical protein SAMD00019534_043490 [Acytostelium subglobosum LB1]GAM21174.1 hypothetical protein SAMD00019534_043490 [Acytostelium subglobosum LB1]|eukprot:XP_012756308.1 hypothetical protein SAMD00019534_043490 [Acytostelium subglobosum LB1]